jgi:hypothetical protein
MKVRRERMKRSRVWKGKYCGKGLGYRGILTLHRINLHGEVQEGAVVISLPEIFARVRSLSLSLTHTHTRARTHVIHVHYNMIRSVLLYRTTSECEAK